MDEKKKDVKQILWLNVKKDTTMSNLIALLVIPALTISIGGYVNANMPYLLQDPFYFNVPFG